MVKNIDEKENSFQDVLQEDDVLNNNKNPSGIYFLWQNIIWEKIATSNTKNVCYWLWEMFCHLDIPQQCLSLSFDKKY